MRKWIAAAFLMACTSTAMLCSQTIAKMQLPCESSFQVLSPNGSQLAVQCKDKSVQLVDVREGAARTAIPAEPAVNTFVYSPSGAWLAAGFDDGSVELIATGGTASHRSWTADSHRIDLLYFFPDNKSLFVGPVDSSGTVWDITGTPMRAATLPVDFGGIDACAVSPDGKVLVAAGDDTIIRWYDTATWKKTLENRDFLLETFVLAFTGDGKQLLAGGADARLTVFDTSTGKQIHQLPPEAGSSVGVLNVLGNTPRVVAVYFDNAGEKPPHALLWDLATATSAPLKTDAPPTCGGAVGSKLWVCTTEGKTLTIAQRD